MYILWGPQIALSVDVKAYSSGSPRKIRRILRGVNFGVPAESIFGGAHEGETRRKGVNNIFYLGNVKPDLWDPPVGGGTTFPARREAGLSGVTCPFRGKSVSASDTFRAAEDFFGDGRKICAVRTG